MNTTMPERADFFISYTEADRGWAEWIAWQLEEAHYSTVLQAWDFRPGTNFVVKMDEVTQHAERTILVLSPRFLESNFTPAEWSTAFARDPKGEKRLAVPVLIENVDVEGLLAQIVYVDLTNKSGDEAVKALLAGVAPGRSKPSSAPPFPGRVRQPVPQDQNDSSAVRIDWKSYVGDPQVMWRSETQDWPGRSGGAVLEVHLIPLQSEPVPVASLRALPDALAAMGRQAGLFTGTQEVSPKSTAEYALVETVVARDSEQTGLLFTRQGQRGAWIELPTDMLGSVFDPTELVVRVATVLNLLMSADLSLAERYSVAAKVSPTMMLSVGDAGVIGNRTSSQMSGRSQDNAVIPIDDSVSSAAISANAADVAAEIVARLQAQL